MCGIFGIAAFQNSHTHIGSIKECTKYLLHISEVRGREASGLACVTDSSVVVLKEAIAASKFASSKRFNEFFKRIGNSHTLQLIGHARLVTNGREIENRNNQPLVRENLVGVHNGIIVNLDTLWDKHADLKTETEVDSEVILALLLKYLQSSKSLAGAVRETYREISGAAAIAVLDSQTNQTLLATNFGSLYYLYVDNLKMFIFASQHDFLASLIDHFPSIFPKGILSNITKLQPDSALVLNDDGSRVVFDLGAEEVASHETGQARGEKLVIDLSTAKRTPIPTTDYSEVMKEFYRASEEDLAHAKTLKRCSRCLLTNTMPFIHFDTGGVCNYCHNYLSLEYQGLDELKAQLSHSSSKTARCVVGISGGRDSCYGLHYLKEVLGLDVVAYTYDWGMVTDLARRNISRMCSKLGVEHILVSANIARKRRFIRKNVNAWLARPNLGLIPLFMAGDKAYFYHCYQVKKKLNASHIILCENMLERTDFKSGFAGVFAPPIDRDHVYTLGRLNKLKIISFYLKHFLLNPRYLNESLIDSAFSFICYYLADHSYLNLYRFIPWKEEEVVSTLLDHYDWEVSDNQQSTWRIGDATAAFYNYIYHHVAGFTENEALRSNQIREGLLDRSTALALVQKENEPNFPAIKWYCETNGIDLERTLKVIRSIPRLAQNA